MWSVTRIVGDPQVVSVFLAIGKNGHGEFIIEMSHTKLVLLCLKTQADLNDCENTT